MTHERNPRHITASTSRRNRMFDLLRQNRIADNFREPREQASQDQIIAFRDMACASLRF